MRYQVDELSGLSEYLGGGLTAIKEQLLAEVEERAKKGATDAVKYPLLISYGVGGLALILAFLAILKK